MLAVDWTSQATNETSLTQHVKTQHVKTQYVKTQLKFDYGYWGLWFFGVYFFYDQLGQFQSTMARSKMLQINIAQSTMAKIEEFPFIMMKLQRESIPKVVPSFKPCAFYSVKSAIKSTKYSVNTILRNPQLQCKRYEYEINTSRRIISRCLGVELQDELCRQRWQKSYCVALQCSRKRYTTSLPRSIQNPIPLANG